MTAVEDNEPRVSVRQIAESDRPEWVRLREALWPGSIADHEEETRRHFETQMTTAIVFVAEAGGQIVGFLELDYRTYAPGCRSSQVPFIEGWYVEPGLRRLGIGRALIEAAEACAVAAGHNEIASDADSNNVSGVVAHLAVGYDEVERVVCFRKSLAQASS